MRGWRAPRHAAAGGHAGRFGAADTGLLSRARLAQCEGAENHSDMASRAPAGTPAMDGADALAAPGRPAACLAVGGAAAPAGGRDGGAAALRGPATGRRPAVCGAVREARAEADDEDENDVGAMGAGARRPSQARPGGVGPRGPEREEVGSTAGSV
jgi:hypothetical protein